MTTPSYARFAEPPTAYTSINWDGSNTQAITDFLLAHDIAADVVPSGTNLFLLMPNSTPSSMTFPSGAAVVLFNAGNGWRLDSTRTNTIGLVSWADLYTTAPDGLDILATGGPGSL